MVELTALGAALCFGFSASLQRREVLAVSAQHWRGLTALVTLFRNWLWLLAGALSVVGVGLQLTALRIGNLMVVSILLSSGLIVALIFDALLTKAKIPIRGWIMALCITISTAVFVIFMGKESGGAPDTFSLAIVTGVALLFNIALLIKIKKLNPFLLAIGAGLSMGMANPLAKAAVEVPIAHLTPLHIITLVGGKWELYLALEFGLSGTWMLQHAYRLGPLVTSLPTVTVSQPIIATAIGIAFFDEQLPSGIFGMAIVTVAFLVILISLWQLSSIVNPKLLSTTNSKMDPKATH
ncbi:MAG: DMT family transporter [Actinobacteria bacterium]|nr:DMT family transporter [Actinomycetota bacterium]MCL6104427.1 DMT family transporter [Actinomycetota bacterium]